MSIAQEHQHNGSRTDPARELAEGLGGASLGLGVPMTPAPGRFAEAIGVYADEQTRRWTRIVGLRALAAAAGILVLERPRPVASLWARVAGDAMDMALLIRAWQAKRADAGRLAGAIGSVVGIAAADLLA